MSPPSGGKHLPPEITEAILCLLSAKALGRFKSVSKTWNSLISSPQFIKTHVQQYHHTTKLIALSATRSLYSIDITQTLDTDDNDIPATGKQLSIGSPPIWWKILGSCNGLVLAQDVSDKLFLMNPTTQELWKVPPYPFAPSHEEHEEYEEVYVMYGFGYDSSTDDYKIVSISFWHPYSMHDSKEMFACVYSLRNNSWRKLRSYYYHEQDFLVVDVVNGAIISQTLRWLSRQFNIVEFNLANEEFNELFPDSNPRYKTILFSTMVDVGEKLGVFMRNEECFECCVMEGYGVAQAWTKVCIHGVDKDRVLLPVCLLQGRNQEIVFQDIEGGVVVYNIDERIFRDVRIVDGPGGNVNVFGGTFVESLESPKHIMIES